ncbi:MAG: tryptophan 7-halogenase [Enhygromyxa sp.]
MNSEKYVDCVVIGGGPAGACFAGIIKKYAPQQSVLVLEKARFPRWHIGESTIPVANGVLRDLGVLERIREAPFVKKLGVSFVWGHDREPWHADFLSIRESAQRGATARDIDAAGQVIDVTGQSFADLLGDPDSSRDTLGQPFTAFNVLRAEFDELLLDHARSLGAEVREGHQVVEVTPVHDHEGEQLGLEVGWRRDDGVEGRVRAGFVLDASGLSHLMTRGAREYDDTLNNFATFGYLSGARWKVTYNGTREASTVFVASIADGWIWYFPVRDDVMSVGVVTNTRHFKRGLERVDLEQWFWEHLRSCPELAPLVAEASLRSDILPHGRKVAACRDWSSRAREPIGEGWAAAGDAAMFLDPVLSTGVTLALQTGHRAAYTYLSALETDAGRTRELWQAYARYLQAEYASYRTLVRYFYANNRAAPSWWWEAQRLVNLDGRLDISDREAFSMATAGFFPVPRAFGTNAEVVAKMLDRLGRPQADLYAIYRDSGVPSLEQIARASYRPVAGFRLALRTEPGLELGRRGRLEAYYDLHTDAPELAHRLSARPARIPAALAPTVERMQGPGRVAELLEHADAYLDGALPDPGTRRELVLQLVATAALKGLVELHDAVPLSPAGEAVPAA